MIEHASTRMPQNGRTMVRLMANSARDLQSAIDDVERDLLVARMASGSTRDALMNRCSRRLDEVVHKTGGLFRCRAKLRSDERTGALSTAYFSAISNQLKGLLLEVRSQRN